MKIQKNMVVTVEITDMGTDGEGIGRISLEEAGGVQNRTAGEECEETAQSAAVEEYEEAAQSAAGEECAEAAQSAAAGRSSEGYTLFVKDAVIGDRVEARIVKPKKNFAYARLERVVTPSPFRTEPRCAFSRQCGGCQIQALQYEKQLEFKHQKVRGNLIRIGGFEEALVDAVMEAPVGMEEPFGYRNKAQFPVGYDREGRLITGFYAGRTHRIIANRDCALGVPENRQILDLILDFMEENHISAYREEEGRGLVRHILIRKGFATGEMMVCLILNGRKLPGEEKLADLLWQQIPGMTSFSVNTNTERTNVIMGEKTRTVRGSDTITDTIGGISFRISPQSFYQVNPVQTERIYAQALAYAGLTGKETVWDLYCGIGTISLFLAQKARQVYGVEIVDQAIADAKENARRNGISNAAFWVGKAEEVLPEKYKNEQIHADVIVVDPPRKGCDEACLETMARMQPDRIVYVSCDSATLARDLKYLCAKGYALEKVRAFDNFPQGVHVETVCLLSKLKSAQRIEGELDRDEL